MPASAFYQYLLPVFLLAGSANAQNTFSCYRKSRYIYNCSAAFPGKGGARIGNTANYVNIDSATGNLSLPERPGIVSLATNMRFNIQAIRIMVYFFNSTSVQYEFEMEVPFLFFTVNANTGNKCIQWYIK